MRLPIESFQQAAPSQFARHQCGECGEILVPLAFIPTARGPFTGGGSVPGSFEMGPVQTLGLRESSCRMSAAKASRRFLIQINQVDPVLGS